MQEGIEQELELQAAAREAEDEQAAVDRLVQRVARCMTDAAFEEFPVLKQMDEEQIRQFGESVIRGSTTFGIRVAQFALELD